MERDLPSRGQQLRRCAMSRRLVPIDQFAPADLQSISRTLASSPNLCTLTVQSDLYVHLSTINPDLQFSFHFRPHLEVLEVQMMDEDSEDEMVDYMSEWDLPSLRECYHDYGTITITWYFEESFHKIIHRLHLSEPPIDSLEWRVPCENVTELRLGHAPCDTIPLNLPFVFPNVKSVVLHDRGWGRVWDVDNVRNGIDEGSLAMIYQKRASSLDMHGRPWTYLKSLESDLHAIY
ncbi:hypothetical protein K474DRAFT_1157381 [Panus rudis PR-1116 ss-1]|nr:hypothetical protein K474DRAFT_1157381 [Panus rudis PR-1116 ss-1]